MRSVTVFIFVASLLLAGCTKKNLSLEDDQFKFVNEQARKCVDTLSKSVKENNEPYTFSFAYYVSMLSVPVINASYTKSEKHGIPYFIAPTRDKNNPGSAWRECMSEHNALDPNILFPEYNEIE